MRRVPGLTLYDRIDELSAHLWAETRRAVPENCDLQQQPRVEAVRFTPKKSRTIFLAKPASDMAEAYDRLTKELEGRGYRVTPGRHEEIPHDPSALDFVDAALDAAEMSIHLLGEKFGRSPEDLPPISKLQLERAARRGANEFVFHRLIWAPKQFKVGLAGTALRRDPQKYSPNLIVSSLRTR